MRLLVASALAMLAMLALASPAAALIDHRITVTPSATGTWVGRQATGNNQNFDAQTGTPCAHAPATSQCDSTLVNVNVPASFWDNQGGGVEIDVGQFT